jgi:hypothetical protein
MWHRGEITVRSRQKESSGPSEERRTCTICTCDMRLDYFGTAGCNRVCRLCHRLMASLQEETRASQADAQRAYVAALEELSPEQRKEGHLNSAQVRRSAARRLLEGRAPAAAHEMPPLANPPPPENVAPPNSGERNILDPRSERLLVDGLLTFGEEYATSLLRIGHCRALEKAQEEAETALKQQRQGHE